MISVDCAAFTVCALLTFAVSVRLVARRLNGRQAERDRGFYRQMALLEVGFLAGVNCTARLSNMIMHFVKCESLVVHAL